MGLVPAPRVERRGAGCGSPLGAVEPRATSGTSHAGDVVALSLAYLWSAHQQARRHRMSLCRRARARAAQMAGAKRRRPT
jgi:hypothetical protein